MIGAYNAKVCQAPLVLQINSMYMYKLSWSKVQKINQIAI